MAEPAFYLAGSPKPPRPSKRQAVTVLDPLTPTISSPSFRIPNVPTIDVQYDDATYYVLLATIARFWTGYRSRSFLSIVTLAEDRILGPQTDRGRDSSVSFVAESSYDARDIPRVGTGAFRLMSFGSAY